MAAYPLHLRLTLDPDPRLAAAAGGAIRYFADAAGLQTELILQLQSAVVAACVHCFDAHNSPTACEIAFERRHDRLQVELFFPGQSPRFDSQTPTWPGIDEITRESRENSSVLRLTKFLAAA